MVGADASEGANATAGAAAAARERESGGRLEAAPGLARIAAAAWMRTAGWSTGLAVRAGRRTLTAALHGENPLTLVREAQVGLATEAQRLLGSPQAASEARERRRDPSLRERGLELLERSSELEQTGEEHPAYVRILDQLSPDEARILRLLATEGPQAAVDVRIWRPLDVGSNVVAPGLTMIAQHAGSRFPDRVPAYLSNLYRLGLIWFSRDTLPDPAPYQVLEAQPDVIEAIREAGRARVVRRSIHLTPFGADFCRMSLPVDTAEIESLGD